MENNNIKMKFKCDCPTENDGCNKGCKNTLGYAPELSLAMAYVPDQEWTELYDMECALKHGTLFKQLDKPFFGWRCQ